MVILEAERDAYLVALNALALMPEEQAWFASQVPVDGTDSNYYPLNLCHLSLCFCRVESVAQAHARQHGRRQRPRCAHCDPSATTSRDRHLAQAAVGPNPQTYPYRPVADILTLATP
jgi:hypothetical protein